MPKPNLNWMTIDDSFNEVPDELRHKVTVRLNAEITGSFPGDPPDIKTPLNETFNTVELVGKPLSIGHFVDSFSPPSLVFGYTTHTYSPYILIGDNDSDFSNDIIIRGDDYQELLSNFPLSSQFLTGLFLEMDVISPDGKVETHERTLVDRIGFAVRQNGGSVSAGFSGEEPVISVLDIVTINTLPGLQFPAVLASIRDRLVPLQERLGEIQSLINTNSISDPPTEEQLALLNEAASISQQILIAANETMSISFAGASDEALSQHEQGYLTKAYYLSPRLLLTISKKDGNDFKVMFDLRKTDLRTVPAPGQVANQSFNFEIARGLLETALETEILSQATQQQVISVSEIFNNIDAAEELAFIFEENLHKLETLNISDEAKARITKAAKAGKAVLTPTRMVTINSISTIGWYETDMVTGNTISVMEDGGHQSWLEYNGLLLLLARDNFIIINIISRMHGFSATILIFIGEFIENLTSNLSIKQIIKNAKIGYPLKAGQSPC